MSMIEFSKEMLFTTAMNTNDITIVMMASSTLLIFLADVLVTYSNNAIAKANVMTTTMYSNILIKSIGSIWLNFKNSPIITDTMM